MIKSLLQSFTCVFVILFVFISAMHLHAQLNPVWISTYNGPLNYSDGAVSIMGSASGNIYVFGTSCGTGDFGRDSRYDYATIKYNSEGVQQWVRRYHAYREEDATALGLDGLENVYVTGWSEDSLLSETLFATIKYDSSGNQLWLRRYKDNAYDYWCRPYDMSVDNSGNVVIVGEAYGRYVSGGSSETIKYNSNGVLLWAKAYNGDGHGYNEANAVFVDNYGSVYITGDSYDEYAHQRYLTIKYNSAGVQQWAAVTGVSDVDYGLDIEADLNHNVYITGYSKITTQQFNMELIKYDSSGLFQWRSSFTGYFASSYTLYYPLPKLLKVGDSGNIYVSCAMHTTGYDNDYAVLKYDPSGNLLWSRTYGAPGNGIDRPEAMIIDASENVYITGLSEVYPSHYDTYVILKYDSSGNQIYAARNNLYNDYFIPYALYLDNNNSLFATGEGSTHWIQPGDEDFFTVKFNELIGINIKNSKISGQFLLYQNYPNPFNPTTSIKFDVPANVKRQTSNVKLVIYNMLGQEVATLVDEQLKPGSYEVKWDGSDYPSGVYFYKLEAGSFAETKKMVLLK